MRSVKLRIIHTTDVHGCLFPFDTLHGKETTGSLSRVFTYVKKLRLEYGNNLLLFDSGDVLQGDPICYYSNFIDTDHRNLVAAAINMMRYDAMTIGNHDIETGHAVYDKFMNECNSPVLAANAVSASSSLPYFKPYTIIRRSGIKIAVVGMLTQAIPYWLSRKLWDGIEFEDTLACSTKILEYLRENEKPDFIVGLFHTGLNGGICIDGYAENSTENIVKNTDGFDLVLFGHDHKRYCSSIENRSGRGVLCVNPSSNAGSIGDIEVTFSVEDGPDGIVRVKDKYIHGEVKSVEDFRPDSSFLDEFSHEYTESRNYLDRVIGVVDRTVKTRDCYFGPALFTDFIHRVQMDVSGARISFVAPLSFDETLFVGNIRVKDIFNLYKYENQICALRMKGSEILGYLEMSYDLWITAMSSPDGHIMKITEYEYEGHSYSFFSNLVFNFDTAAGFRYTVDVTKPYGHRVCIGKMSDGSEFCPDEWYVVAMHSYRANGGTEFLTKGAGIPFDELHSRIVFQSEKDQRSCIIQDIERNGKMCFSRVSDWKFIPEDWAVKAVERDRKLLFGD